MTQANYREQTLRKKRCGTCKFRFNQSYRSHCQKRKDSPSVNPDIGVCDLWEKKR